MKALSGEIAKIAQGLAAGQIIPYLGPSVLKLDAANAVVPGTPEELVLRLIAKASVPHKIRNNLTATAQFIENFKHRKTVVNLMNEAFALPAQPTVLHRYLATLPNLPLIVDVWYDAAMALALQEKATAQGAANWGQVQGLSQAEHFGKWAQFYHSDDSTANATEAQHWATLLYKPLGGIQPKANYIVSDSDYVEVLTEIDIQTPIPLRVQEIRRGRQFVFMGCRFANQLERSFARQIMKRSSAQHWAVLPEEPTKNEKRFMAEQNIQRLDMPLAEFVDALLHGVLPEVRTATA
jgi:SIR2-like domain